MTEVARRGLQMSTDRAAGLVTVPNVALPEGEFDCNVLLRDGVPTYRIVTAVATIQFLVDGDEQSSKIRATANFGRISTVDEYGTQRTGFETCYSTHRFEDSLVGSIAPTAPGR
jgi:hypothetical protein